MALSEAENATVLNIDLGGGTTKLSLIRNGLVASTAAIEVGARLIALGEGGVVVRLEQPAKTIMDELAHISHMGEYPSE